MNDHVVHALMESFRLIIPEVILGLAACGDDLNYVALVGRKRAG